MSVRSDCRFFLGHRPCDHHKRHGIPCSDCPDFQPRGPQVLIIHLGAAGDVLRTQFLAASLKKEDPRITLTWLTAADHLPLFRGIDDVDRVMPTSVTSLMELLARRFDRIINLEMEAAAAGLAMRIPADRKDGFGLDPEGFLLPFGDSAQELYRLSTDDHAKRANRKTRQQLLLEMLGLPGPAAPPRLHLTDEERTLGLKRLEALGLEAGPRLIGLNVGSSRRWKAKRWPMDHFRRLAELLRMRNLEPVYLAGPTEPELVDELRGMQMGPLVNPQLSLRDYAAVLHHLPVVVTGDTLALHMTVGLGGRVVALFGPTSAAEIDLFGQGEKLQAADECQCYFHAVCSHTPSCMEMISPDLVLEAVLRQREAGSKAGGD